MGIRTRLAGLTLLAAIVGLFFVFATVVFDGGDGGCGSSEVLGPIEVGLAISDMAVDEEANLIYVSEFEAAPGESTVPGHVAIIDGSMGVAGDPLGPFGNRAFGIAVDSGTIYLGVETVDLEWGVAVINAGTGTFSIPHTFLDADGVWGVGVRGDFVYIAVNRSAGESTVEVMSIDGLALGTPIPTGAGAYGVAVDEEDAVYVATGDGILMIGDGVPSTISRASTFRLAVNAETDTIYATGGTGEDATLGVIDATTGAIDERDVGIISGPQPLGVDESRPCIYVLNSNPGGPSELKIIEGEAYGIAQEITVGEAYPPPMRLGVNSATNRIYVPDQVGGTLWVIEDD